MGVEVVQKVGIAGVKKDWNLIIDTIQEAGMMEIKPIEAAPDSPGEEKNTLTQLKNAVDYLKKFAAKTPEKLELTPTDLSQLVNSFSLDQFLVELQTHREKLTQMESDRKNKQLMLTELEPWLGLEHPLRNIRDTEFTRIKIGMIPLALTPGFQDELARQERDYHLEKTIRTGKGLYFLLLYHRKDQQEFDNLLTKYEFAQWAIKGYSDTPKNEFNKLQDALNLLEEQIEHQNKRLKELAEELPQLGAIYDYHHLLLQQSELRGRVQSTASSFLVQGWIPERKLPDLRLQIESSARTVDILELPLAPDETPPVALKNNKLVEPFEVVTDLYGRPHKGYPDPTPYLTPFFPVYFALCLTEAGYGLIITLVGILLFFKFKNNPGARKFIKFIIYLGVVSIVVGALAGGYFGIDLSKLPPQNPLVKLALSIKLFDPLMDALIFFAIALVCGIVQVSVGFIINGIIQFQIRDNIFLKIRAIVLSLSWVAITVGLGIYILSNLVPEAVASILPVAIYLVKYGVASMVLGTVILGILARESVMGAVMGALGFDGLYGIINLFGDILSYSRILALGLSTGVIAGVINIIAGNVAQIPVVGIFIALLMAVVAHIGYTAISALGAFVHPARLQFVEFFGKFYESGGKPLKPFKKIYPNINLK
ncbi:V-type ATP synthase subunit I [bacterium]|nr:V-type ATP synthase subunit I [bacterium]